VAKMVVIADDLTGAADCAAACAAHGIAATVVLHAPGPRGADLCWPDADIVSIDANTRWMSAEQAAETTAELAGRWETNAGAGGCLLFKKVDSTLRGNMAAEVAAMLRTGDQAAMGKRRFAVMAPALPAQGRTTRGGLQMVHGRLLEETDLWKSEERKPRSEIAVFLAEAGLSCRVIDGITVRSGLSRLKDAMERFSAEADVVLCDAETDDDLRAIAQASMALEDRPVWAGSAGLAAQLPPAAGMKARSGASTIEMSGGPTLFVVGSAASVTRQQMETLAAAADVVVERFTPSALLHAQAASTKIVEGLASGCDVLVALDGSEQCSSDEAQLFGRALSRLIAPCAAHIGALVATGGETARAVLDALGVDRLKLMGEVEPGLPFSITDGWIRALPVLTKAGGFGQPQTLVHCREFVQQLRHGPATAEARGPSVS
jgi:uncharacterized protein YgbK (DUF1537 family)